MCSFPDSRQDDGYLVTERMYSVTKHVIVSRDLHVCRVRSIGPIWIRKTHPSTTLIIIR